MASLLGIKEAKLCHCFCFSGPLAVLGWRVMSFWHQQTDEFLGRDYKGLVTVKFNCASLTRYSFSFLMSFLTGCLFESL